MGSRRSENNLWIVFAVFIVLGLIANGWISSQLKTLEEESAVSASSSGPEIFTPEPSGEYYGVVAIDPDNDPLAPVQKTSVKVANKVEQSSYPPEPSYEVSTDSPILVQ